MPRQLTFKIKRKEYAVTPVRVDRKKLYGWSEIVAEDDEGRPCRIVNTDDSGQFMIDKGGTAMAVITPEGSWVDRNDLLTVDENGAEAALIPSSYGSVIELESTVSEEEFLEYSITTLYQLADSDASLLKSVGTDIYHFLYCYTAECEGQPAFVMLKDDDDAGPLLFLMVGYRNRFEYLSLQQPGFIDEDPDDDENETDELDFAMF